MLANSALSSVPIYFFSFFDMLKWVEKHIDKTRCRSLVKWDKWDRVCKRKEFGGLGLINREILMFLYLLNGGGKLLTSPESTWVKIVRDSYLRNPLFLAWTGTKMTNLHKLCWTLGSIQLMNSATIGKAQPYATSSWLKPIARIAYTVMEVEC